jgi:hypothetical protein
LNRTGTGARQYFGREAEAVISPPLKELLCRRGAAVVLAGHFAKGNPAGKESLDRISGSGVFARDPDSVVTFTRHEEEGAFTVEMTLRNLLPTDPFVVRWEFPLFKREGGLDPSRLKQNPGRPPTHTVETLYACLGDDRLTTTEWKDRADVQKGVSKSRFYVLLNEVIEEKKASKSPIDDKWELLKPKSRNWHDEKDQ